MKLKKLELYGFKSFAEKTEILFEEGITVIVGPNGCGKSNIIDAIKWVLGEQSVKLLRGNEMTDVIFSGTDTRPPLGYAEVSLTIENNKGLLPLEYSEICITRRLYTSGESEYLINKQTSRLKDIRELFMDTGVGAHAYSIIEQGKVDVLLQASAQERRFVFEEAAGISKFKSRKKIALSKLEQVEQNLLRIGDILEELQKQLRSVKLQASKARKYQEYSERLKKLRICVSLKNYRELIDKKTGVTEVINNTAEEAQKITTHICKFEEQYHEAEDRLMHLDHQLAELQNELVSLEMQISKSQDRKQYNQERIEEAELQQKKFNEQRNGLEHKQEELQAKIDETKEVLCVLEQEILKYKELQKTKEIALKQIILECDLLYQGIEEKKSEVISLLQRESSLQNEIGSLSTGKDTLKARKLRLLKRQEDIMALIDGLQSKQQELNKEKDMLADELDHLGQILSARKERAQELIQTIHSLDDQISQQKQWKSSKTSRYEVLMDYEMRAVGIDAGARTILSESGNGNTEAMGVKGMVADLLKVDLPYAHAIETALGEKVQGIIIDTTENAVRAIHFLQRNQKGHAIFFPLDRVSGHDIPVPPEILQAPGVINDAAGLIQSDDTDVRRIISALLHNTVVIKDINTALGLSPRFPGIRWVTPGGELLEPEGVLSGGLKQGQVGIISRKSEIKEIEEQLIQVQQVLERMEQDRHAYARELDSVEAEIAQITEKAEQMNILSISKHNELLQTEQKIDEFVTEKRINDNEIEEIDVETEQVDTREALLNKELTQLNQRRKQLESQIEESSLLSEEKEHMKKTVQEEITVSKIALAQKQENKTGKQHVLTTLISDMQDVQRQIQTITLEGQNCKEKKKEAEEEIQQQEQLISVLQAKVNENQDLISSLKMNREEICLMADEIKAQLETRQKEYSALEQQMQEARLKENEFHIHLSHLEERIREEYQIELSSLINSSEEASFDLHSLQPEHPDTSGDCWNNISEEIEELRKKIERLGNVNLEAIREHDELENREAFLKSQKEDLERSHRALNDLIKKIEHTSRELFDKTFRDIRLNFQAMFRKLFGGGKADIILEEAVDILEADIDIVAQPPNKELRSITLLSGGEKVMTAVALVFAVFQAKPSPFCILDEVDAALDESNVNRFTMILKEFVKDTQFMIITHNKGTMSIADVLYGITMQETGISRKISVKFEEIESEVA